jgi:proline iminopeptidase
MMSLLIVVKVAGSSSSPSQTETQTAPSSSSSSGTSSRAQPSINQSQSNKSNMSSQLAQARLECHYFVNGGFLEDNQLLLGIPKMQSIPGIIVQGRYDFVCPLVVSLLDPNLSVELMDTDLKVAFVIG